MIPLQILGSTLQKPDEFSMVIDLSPKLQHRLNTQSNEPEEMKIDESADSIGTIQNNIEHQNQATPA